MGTHGAVAALLPLAPLSTRAAPALRAALAVVIAFLCLRLMASLPVRVPRPRRPTGRVTALPLVAGLAATAVVASPAAAETPTDDPHDRSFLPPTRGQTPSEPVPELPGDAAFRPVPEASPPTTPADSPQSEAPPSPPPPAPPPSAPPPLAPPPPPPPPAPPPPPPPPPTAAADPPRPQGTDEIAYSEGVEDPVADHLDMSADAPAPPPPEPGQRPQPQTTAPREPAPSPSSPSAPPDSAAGPPPVGPPSEAPEAGTYLVVAGDCLWTIAADVLGAGSADADIDRYWRRIYQANRDVVGDDPDLIYPGHRLTLPNV